MCYRSPEAHWPQLTLMSVIRKKKYYTGIFGKAYLILVWEDYLIIKSAYYKIGVICDFGS